MTFPSYLVRRIGHVFFLLGLAVAPASVRAQQASLTESAPVRTDPPLTDAAPARDATPAPEQGPRVQPVALRSARTLPSSHADAQATRAVADNAPVPLPRRAPSVGAPVALIGVGLAAIIIGSVVGGDSGTIIVVSGAAIGLAGLYVYLR